MSVARKTTPKFAENSRSRSPLQRPKRSVSPNASPLIKSSPLSKSHKENLPADFPIGHGPFSYSSKDLRESIEMLRQLKSYESEQGSRKNQQNDLQKYGFEGSNRELEAQYSNNERRNSRGSGTMEASRNMVNSGGHGENMTIKPYTLAWRAASHDAQARVLKLKNNQWPGATDLLGKMEKISNRMSENNNSNEEFRRKGRKLGGIEKNPMERRCHPTPNDGRNFTEIKRLRVEANRSKKQIKGKIDLINSLYEEFALGPRDKPVMPSNRPVLPIVPDTKGTPPTSLRVMNNTEIDEVESSVLPTESSGKGKKNKKGGSGDKNGKRKREGNNGNKKNKAIVVEEEEEVEVGGRDNNNISATFGNDGVSNSEGEDDDNEMEMITRNRIEQLNLASQRLDMMYMEQQFKSNEKKRFQLMANNHNNSRSNEKVQVPDNTLRRKSGGTNLKSADTTNRSGLALQEEEDCYYYDHDEGIEGRERSSSKGFLRHEEEEKLNEDFSSSILSKKKEKNRPPLPKRKWSTIQQHHQEQKEGEEGELLKTPHQYFSSTMSYDSNLSTQKEGKNYVEMNKTSSGKKKKRYVNYEKVLRNVEQTCRPLLETLKKVSAQNSGSLRGARCSSTRSSRKESPGSIRSNSKQNTRRESSPIGWSSPFKELAQVEEMNRGRSGGFGDTMTSIKAFYEEMNNLTMKITKAASVMQNTLDRLEKGRGDEGGEARWMA